MKGFLVDLIRIFLPTPCIQCGELQRRVVCRFCVSGVSRLERQLVSPGINRVFCYFPYQGLVKSLIHRSKFGPSIEAATEIFRLVDFHSPIVDFSLYQWVVAVPGSRNRIRSRGFSLPDLIFRRYVRLSPIIIRKRDTRPLYELTPAQRISELAHAFEIVECCIDPGDSVLIIDDILTSGATAAQMATLCRNAGATQVDLLVIAAVETELNDSD